MRQDADVDSLERLRAWSYGRQRLGDPARTLGQALHSVVAVYATHPTAPLALWARTTSFDPARYRSFDRDRKGVRVPAMRRTVFLVPEKSAAQVFSATGASSAHALGRLKSAGVSARAYEGHATKILRAATEPVSRKELEEVAGIKGNELGTVLRALRYEGRLLTLAGESLLMSPHSFVSTKAWLGSDLDSGDPDAALEWLAGEYLKGYGPARIADFAWWAGTTKRAATKALEVHDTVDVGGGLLLHTKDEPKFAKVTGLRNALALLPKWDAYTMGLAPDGRERFVHPENQKRVYTPIGTGLAGDGNPVVLIDGEAVATWTFTLKEGPALHPFDTLGPKSRTRVDEKLNEVAALLTS